MTTFKKIAEIRRHLRGARAIQTATAGGKRVQKNLSILERDAERLKTLAAREKISQARLLSEALDAYEQIAQISQEAPPK